MRNFLLSLVLVLSACSTDTLTTPTPLPSPSPDKVDPISCVQADARTSTLDDQTSFVTFGEFAVEVVAYNAAGNPLGSGCAVNQVIGWNYAGPCRINGSTSSRNVKFFCTEPGDLDGFAVDGKFKATFHFRIVR